MASHLRHVCSASLFNSRQLCSIAKGVAAQQVAGYKNFPKPPTFSDVVMPEATRLKFLTKVPVYHQCKPPKYSKRLDLISGLEEIHNSFLHNQYGIVANNGGHLEWGHLEMIRTRVSNKIDSRKMFAVWRIDSPWLSRVKKGSGKRMGGGKANINRHVVPIKTDRVIIEMGGKCTFEEVYPILKVIVNNLPFPAEAITAEKLEHKKMMMKKYEEANMNPLNWQYLIKNNIFGCEKWVSKMDKEYFGRCA